MLSWNADHAATMSAPSLAANVEYTMPINPRLTGTATVPELFVNYLNSTCLKGPFRDVHKESIESHGQVLVDLVEYFTGKSVSKRSRDQARDKSPNGLCNMYTSVLLFLERHGVLVNTVLPEFLLDQTAFVAMLDYREARDTTPQAQHECGLWCARQCCIVRVCSGHSQSPVNVRL
jgi:hypothetical protein